MYIILKFYKLRNFIHSLSQKIQTIKLSIKKENLLDTCYAGSCIQHNLI
jgi:hypothetical protein